MANAFLTAGLQKVIDRAGRRDNRARHGPEEHREEQRFDRKLEMIFRCKKRPSNVTNATFVLVLPSGVSRGANEVCFFKSLTSCSSSVFRFCNCCTARSSFWIRSESDALCAHSDCVASVKGSGNKSSRAEGTTVVRHVFCLLAEVRLAAGEP
jgi:hypothetical protein